MEQIGENNPKWPMLRANLALYELCFVKLHHTFTWHLSYWVGWVLHIHVSFRQVHGHYVATAVRCDK